MNRTARSAVVATALVLAEAFAQEAGKDRQQPPQADPIAAVVAELKAAEAKAASFRVELATRGALASGLQFTTSGTLTVLRGAQPATRSRVAFSFANGLEGHSDWAQTADGVTTYSDDPALGEVFVRIPPIVVVDLEWAGTVLQRADLPGMQDRRADAPLGSRMLEGLRVHYALEPVDKQDARKERSAAAGQWFAGERRGGTGDLDPDLPMATRCEVFVGRAPAPGRAVAAVLEVVHWQGDKELQRIEVGKLEVDVPLPPETFVVDGHGQKLRDVSQFPPLAEAIERTLVQAESRAGVDAAGAEVVRPSGSVAAVLADVRAAESGARTIHVEVATTSYPAGRPPLATTEGVWLRRGERAAVRTLVSTSGGGAPDQRADTARSPDGVGVLREDPAMGKVFARLAPAMVADLDWAAELLQRTDLPNRPGARSSAPLGSQVLEDLRSRFLLRPSDKKDERRERSPAAGVWFAGPRRPGSADADVPWAQATRCEVFVGKAPAAVLELTCWQGDKVVLHSEVTRLELDANLPAEAFLVDGRGQQPRDVAQFPAFAEELERVLREAEEKANQEPGSDVVRPSKRK